LLLNPEQHNKHCFVKEKKNGFFNNILGNKCFRKDRIMRTWEDNIEIIRRQPENSEAARCEKGSKIAICEAAESMGIRPEELDPTRSCCFQTIIRRSKAAIAADDARALAKLFFLERTLTVSELRLRLGIPRIDDVNYTTKETPGSEELMYSVDLTREQFSKIARRNKLQIKFNQGVVVS
jgi:hypothetical protein